jgi:hypothetical protein
MAEYRVTALYFRFRSASPSDRWDWAEPWSGDVGPFRCALEDGVLKAVPTQEFRDRGTARVALERELAAWKQDAYLSEWRYRIDFEFVRDEVEEVDPAPGSVTLFPPAIEVTTTVYAPTITRVNRMYPTPPAGFVSTPLTGLMVERLERAREGRETWPAFAYFVLTQLEIEYGGPKHRRSVAAKRLAVSYNVLDRLGKICDTRDPDVGRKAGPTPERISPAEREWLEVAVVRLIRRSGEHSAGGSMKLITMADLPPIG